MEKKIIIAIVQVRMGSKRLPGKAMKFINGKYVFELVHKRLKKSKLLDQIIFSTSKKKENDILVSEFKKKKINFFRGKENDVLDRYFHTAKKFQGSVIVRITCDCPFVDPQLIDNFIQTQQKGKFDYVSNCLPYTFPNGMDIEVFTFKLLKTAFNKATTKQKANGGVVLRFVRDNRDLFNVKNINSKDKNIKKYRLTLDNKRDLVSTKKIYNHFYPNIYFKFDDIIKFLKKNV
jgi:spore coat polysaccharide biosynthesis protein SpsF (cytidylyltransferase family)